MQLLVADTVVATLKKEEYESQTNNFINLFNNLNHYDRL
ncbi:hypothetical protein RB2501_12177 [Robiginitalea biformata HTCC2501]|uniref:Uncharacterized protein n=1 Tax=Robiginitalea biformata (strain ATCC BAA-864 / DSM 15991 / KCTC 12146 / HTCC2501) TaxID=313596 RepID=A4CN42_ROBBH|nr:hypothetical protein RB2501_12177 [Robiginitalea biformata HTCC2501]